MTIGEIKAANSIYLNNYFTWAYIRRDTANIVRAKLREVRPDIFY
jgi:hypothetical protein